MEVPHLTHLCGDGSTHPRPVNGEVFENGGERADLTWNCPLFIHSFIHLLHSPIIHQLPNTHIEGSLALKTLVNLYGFQGSYSEAVGAKMWSILDHTELSYLSRKGPTQAV